MKEPPCPGPRRNTMERTAALVSALALCGLVASGCAEPGKPQDAPPTSEPASSQSPSEVYDGCPADAPAVRQATALGRVDLTGDGTPERVLLVESGACGPGLVVRGPDGLSGTRLEAALDPSTATVVDLRDTERELLMVSEPPHPRGGYMVHLYGAGEEGITEVTSESGDPILPFVATDGGAPPTTAVCAADGDIAVLTTVTHKPPGIVLAWDVTTTTYALSGPHATVVERSTEEAIADPILRKERPAMFEPGSYFRNCTVSG